MNYLDHPAHAAWRWRYYETRTGSFHLAVDPAWWEANLKAESPHGRLRVEYRDSQDGKLYEASIYAAWDDVSDCWFGAFDKDWNHLSLDQKVKGLQAYFYNDHHCPCHRKQDAAAAGAVTDDECEGTRFLINRIWAPEFPDLILYSETMTDEELESKLLGKPVDHFYLIQQGPA